MVSKTLKAWSSPSGLVWVGPVQTLAWASSTVWFGFRDLELRYEDETAGFRISDSRSPNWSIVAESKVASTAKQCFLPIRLSLRFEENRRELWIGEYVGFQGLLIWIGEMDESEDCGLSRAFMVVYRSLSLPSSRLLLCLRRKARRRNLIEMVEYGGYMAACLNS